MLVWQKYKIRNSKVRLKILNSISYQLIVLIPHPGYITTSTMKEGMLAYIHTRITLKELIKAGVM